MSMSHTDYTTQPADPQPESGTIDKRYIKGIPGIVKLVAAIRVTSLIAFICPAVTVLWCSWGDIHVKGYFMFATMAAFVTSLFMWLLLLFKLQTRIFKCACVNWPLFECMVYAIIVIFYFFAVLLMSIFACDPARKAACVFGGFGFAAFVVDFALALRVYLAARKAGNEPSASSAPPPYSEAKY